MTVVPGLQQIGATLKLPQRRMICSLARLSIQETWSVGRVSWGWMNMFLVPCALIEHADKIEAKIHFPQSYHHLCDLVH